MVADRTKKLKVSEKGENLDEIDGELVLSIEKLQEIQDELEKVPIIRYPTRFPSSSFFVFSISRITDLPSFFFLEVFMLRWECDSAFGASELHALNVIAFMLDYLFLVSERDPLTCCLRFVSFVGCVVLDQ